MIKVEGQKVYTLNLQISSSDEVFTLFEENINGADSNNNFVNSEEIFNWLKNNTRKFVPFKNVDCEVPSFRTGFVNANTIWVVANWQLSGKVTDWIM